MRMSLLLLVSLSIVVLAEPRALDPKGSKQVVIDEQTAGVIKAKPPVPQVFYVLPRAVLSQGSPEAPAQLAPRIIEAVKAEPF